EARARLRSDVEAMGRHLDEQRTRVRASLVEALRWVDERMKAPATGVRGSEGAEVRADREPSGDSAAIVPRAEPAGPGSAPDPGGQGSGSAQAGAGSGASGALRPQAPPPAAAGHEHQSTASPPPQPSAGAPGAADRTEAPVGARLGVLNGGLFDPGMDETNGSEGNRLGQ
ncbi:MAG TPA: hypothetical protein VMD28_06330, partial [Acidimicrobiales bacterium]|nr:hypothetical protein [Acidimicrobiales bacterium]